MSIVDGRDTKPSGGDSDDRAVAADRLNALAGFEFKQSLPVIEDSDPDLERHVREFQSILDCHYFGRRGIRPCDMLTVFRKTLPAASVRLQVYDTAIKRARKTGRHPQEAKESMRISSLS